MQSPALVVSIPVVAAPVVDAQVEKKGNLKWSKDIDHHLLVAFIGRKLYAPAFSKLSKPEPTIHNSLAVLISFS